MDYYVENLTQTHCGRIPARKCELKHPYEPERKWGWETTLKFIKQCDNAEFREYYFRSGVVDLTWIQILKYIIIHGNPDIFKHAVTEFRREFGGFVVSLNYYPQNTYYDYYISYKQCAQDESPDPIVIAHYNDITYAGEIITMASLIEMGFKVHDVSVQEGTREFFYEI